MNLKNILWISLGMIGCIRPPDYPIEPKIAFLSMSKNTLRQGTSQQDSLWLTFSFTDGDGDLGDKDSLNIFVTDKRDNTLAETYRIPHIPEQGAGNGISGEIKMLLFTTCCKVLPPCEPSLTKPIDTLVYQIVIKDRAGHRSNEIKTPNIYLQCK